MPPNPTSSPNAPPAGVWSRQTQSQSAPSYDMKAGAASDKDTRGHVSSKTDQAAGASSNKATHGSSSSIPAQTDPAAQRRNSNNPAGSSWAIENWLKQAPRDEPWNPLRR